ncbi:MAG: SDR family NAD(P)-dependent oxidoreductase [Fimbriimonadaceae bacterium]|nr:MAG: SDR family NAD(P)-dependent oxidoreductase [Fimbriimonadaceae bacterium]
MKTWFITGASSGFGLILAEKLLAQGDQVVATARKPEALAELSAQSNGNLLIQKLDVNNQSEIDDAIGAAIEKFDKIDVLVNNAGYGMVGTIEEVTDAEVRAQFDTNVFGLLNVTRAALPHMRAAKSGHILNLSSIAGLTSSATFPIYCASKHAVEAISEGLAASVKPFGISVTLIEPGLYRTRFANQTSIRVTENRMSEYDEQMNGTMDWLKEVDGAQPGDPEKAVDAMIAMVNDPNPPLRLLLGPDAWDRAHAKLEALKADFDRNEQITKSAVFN